MKKACKVLYYVFPFVIFSATLVADVIRMKANIDIDSDLCRIIYYTVWLIVPFLMGTFSPSKHKFDYFTTALVPVTMMAVMFVGAYYDIGTCDGLPRKELGYCFRVIFQTPFIILFALQAVITFVSSFHHIRLRKILKKK